METATVAELSAFLAVARHLSFSKAAVERGVAPSAMSHVVRRLETRVGVRLFHRTTRSVALTNAGARLANDLAPAFGQIDDALENLNAFREAPFGTVRLNVPNSIAPAILRDVFEPIVRRNPGLHLEVTATDRLTDIVGEGFDAGIRFGERLSNDMVAVRIRARLRIAVIASPAYVAKHALPTKPGDLARHACIRYRFPSGVLFHWQFAHRGERVQVAVDGPLTLDDQDLMIEAALRGCGLAYVWDHRVLRHLEEGSLVRCLEAWCPIEDDLYLYYASHRHVSAGLRVLIDLLRADLKARDRPPRAGRR